MGFHVYMVHILLNYVTTEDRRHRLLEATLSRVKEETKDSCGTGPAGPVGPAHPSQ